MTLRETLLSQTPKIKPVEINGTTYYVRDLTVGDMNNSIFFIRNWLKKQAELEEYELPNEDDENFEQAINEFGAKYNIPQSIAARLCDENGKLLFDPFDVNDLNMIAELDSGIIIAFNQATAVPKASASEESSS